MESAKDILQKNPLSDITILLRIFALGIFFVYIYSTLSLIDYAKFLNQSTAIFILTILRDIIVLLVIVLGLLFEFLAYLLNVRLPSSFSLLTLFGFTNISDRLILLLKNPIRWVTETLSNLIYGILAFMFVVILVMVIGFVNRGNVENGLWIFFLSELSIFISYAYGLGVVEVGSVINFSSFITTPLFLHSIIAIFYLEFVINLAYLSTYIIPAKQKIEKDIKIISRFERLTPEDISKRVERETRMTVREKLAPLASLFAISEYIGPVVEQKFSTAYLARLKTYYDFIQSKDPKLKTKITGEEVLKKAGYVTLRSFIFSAIKLLLAISLAVLLLYIPDTITLSGIGSRIVDMGLIETYIIYTGTAILFLFVVSEIIKEK